MVCARPVVTCSWVYCMASSSGTPVATVRRATALVVAGGVAANRAVRGALEQVAAEHGLRFVAPPLWLCTDNAAMIAWAGIERLGMNLVDDMTFAARPRWPLDANAEAAHHGKA